jgi:hypothetical protein
MQFKARREIGTNHRKKEWNKEAKKQTLKGQKKGKQKEDRKNMQ